MSGSGSPIAGRATAALPAVFSGAIAQGLRLHPGPFVLEHGVGVEEGGPHPEYEAGKLPRLARERGASLPEAPEMSINKYRRGLRPVAGLRSAEAERGAERLPRPISIGIINANPNF